MTQFEKTTDKPHLLKQALQQFDRLVASGELLYKEVSPHHVPASPFNFTFYIASSLKSKPIDHSQKTPPKKSAFPDSQGDWSLKILNSTHNLILNKFCVLRPQFVLPTIEYQPQSEHLNTQDLNALWDALTGLGGIGIFNCGVQAGSSVGHKHMQVLPWVEGWRMPMMGDLPFQSASLGIESRDEIFAKYSRCRELVGMDEKQPHNVIMTKEMIMVIPRSKGWIEDEQGVTISCNAAGMVGIVFCHAEEEYQAWLRYGPMKALTEFGVALK